MLIGTPPPTRALHRIRQLTKFVNSPDVKTPVFNLLLWRFSCTQYGKDFDRVRCRGVGGDCGSPSGR
jgi:hypothetical protein